MNCIPRICWASLEASSAEITLVLVNSDFAVFKSDCIQSATFYTSDTTNTIAFPPIDLDSALDS